MIYLNNRFSLLMLFLLSILLASIFSSCNSEKGRLKYDPSIWPISKSDISSFQKAYGASFNSVSSAIKDKTYYELKAKEHIDNFYNFDEGEVMFKIGHEDIQPFRYSHAGLLSYLIGKNKDFPDDIGIAKQNWQKVDWNNLGIIMERDVAIAIGTVTMKNEDETQRQNYTMVLKRNNEGKVKLVAHKISVPCE